MPWISSSLEVRHYPELLMEMSHASPPDSASLETARSTASSSSPKRKTFFAPKRVEFDQVMCSFYMDGEWGSVAS